MTKLANSKKTDSNLADDLFGVTEYKFDEPKMRDFLPWHKPRKQYVRQEQWLKLVRDLVDNFEPENRIIKYLGLPGDDLLDLRYFHEKICVPLNIKLKYLGFNKGISTGKDHNSAIEISKDEIGRLPHIVHTSDLIGDDFTKIAIEKSLAWDKAYKMGPFDIINIDLCDGFAKQPIDNFKETHYNTLKKLMTFQAKRRDPWLLLITTRTNSTCVNEGVFQRLKNLYLKNLKECDSFAIASRAKFLVDDEDALDDYCRTASGFSNTFVIGLAKWIVSIGTSQNPQAKVEVKNVMGYKVANEHECPDLVSIAIQITPTMLAGEDLIGLANQVKSEINECSLATKTLDKIYRQIDVDRKLDENEDILEEMILATGILLEQARYDFAKYREWVKTA